MKRKSFKLSYIQRGLTFVMVSAPSYLTLWIQRWIVSLKRGIHAFKLDIVSHIACATIVGMILLIGGCGGGGSGGGDDDTDVHISGTVSAPDGALAFHQPTRLQYMAAMIFYGNAAAAIDGVTDVGAGVTVDLIQVDANGDQVGDVMGKHYH